jgi:hypothetical protein
MPNTPDPAIAAWSLQTLGNRVVAVARDQSRWSVVTPRSAATGRSLDAALRNALARPFAGGA